VQGTRTSIHFEKGSDLKVTCRAFLETAECAGEGIVAHVEAVTQQRWHSSVLATAIRPLVVLVRDVQLQQDVYNYAILASKSAAPDCSGHRPH
jgi:hypothetical protein